MYGGGGRGMLKDRRLWGRDVDQNHGRRGGTSRNLFSLSLYFQWNRKNGRKK